MKKLFKRLFKTAFFRFVIIWLAANIIRLVHYTNRRHYDVDDAALPYMRGEKNGVFAFWHGRLMEMPMLCPPKRKMNVLISSHRDGEMIARTMHRFGFGTVRGSTSRGAVVAGKGALKVLQDGDNVSITPDGPRGPAMKAQEGAAVIARMAGVPVIPITFSCTRHKRARSWDRFMIALPFGTIYYAVGAPLWEVSSESLEAAMVALTEKVDQRAGLIS